MLESFFASHPLPALLCVFGLGTVFGIWMWSELGDHAQSTKANERRARELERAQRLQEASQALAQRLLYVCAAHKVIPFPVSDSRQTGLVRSDRYVYVAPASMSVPPIDDWEERMQEARDVALFQLAPGRLRLLSVGDQGMENQALEFRLDPPDSANAPASSIRFG